MSLKSKQPFKIALYIRVSTEEQAENPEGSIRNQEDRLRHAVTYKNSHYNFGEIKGVYIDAGISAKNMKRPKLQELLAAIRAKEIDLVMVTELSRLSRNTRDFIEMWDMMREHGCQFTSLREDFDTTNAAGELVLFQLMNLAQFERRQTSERVQANFLARSARGLFNGGSVPFGYKLIEGRPGYLDIDEEAAKTVRAAFVAIQREGCLSHAARWLNDNGYVFTRRRQGGGNFKRSGIFTVESLLNILRLKSYTGVKCYKHKDEVKEVKAAWPPIIDETTFRLVGKILDKNRSGYKLHRQYKLPYTLSGVTVCQTCHQNMVGKSATGNTTKVGYYEHSWASKKDSALTKKRFHCEPHRIPAKKLEPLVWSKISEFMTDPAAMKALLVKVRKHHEQNPERKDIERIKVKIMSIESQIDVLSERLAELPKSVSAAPIYKQMEKLQALKDDHELQLKNLKTEGKNAYDRIVGLDTFESFAKHYRQFIDHSADVVQRKRLVKNFIDKIELGVDSVKIHFIVDEDHYKRALALAAGARPTHVAAKNKLSGDFSSSCLTFGTRDRT